MSQDPPDAPPAGGPPQGAAPAPPHGAHRRPRRRLGPPDVSLAQSVTALVALLLGATALFGALPFSPIEGPQAAALAVALSGIAGIVTLVASRAG